MNFRSTFPGLVIALATLILTPGLASAQDLAEAQTSYTGAVMLGGDTDATIGSVYTGANADTVQTDYAFFSGNTLYVGTEDSYGNNVDAIVEFYWFESSIDRDSDFYVAIIKARSSPNVNDDWYLDVGDAPVLGLNASSDITSGSGAFRWDWSLPFENYGIDSYGTTTLTNSYGIGVDAEGSAIASESVDEYGVTVSGTVQTKGFFNSSYRVDTQYQVTLWEWELEVDGNPGSMNWDMVLNLDERDDQNAYHEYFLVMQTDFDEPFTIEALTISAGFDEWNWGFGDTSFAEVTLENITLNAPFWSPPTGDDDDDDDDDDVEGDDDDDDVIDPIGDDDDDDDVEGDDDDGDDRDEDNVSLVNGGCNVAPAAPPSAPGLLALLLLGLGLAPRRRR